MSRNKNKAHYKWSKLFASKRFNSNNGVITLTAFEQQELLDDMVEYKGKKLTPTEEWIKELHELDAWADEKMNELNDEQE